MTSGFVSTKELDDEKAKRQEEWEKVRKPDEPMLAPEPQICNQTLFEQLRNNKEVKDAEMEEAKKFKNMIRGIDEDESDFLAQIDSAKQEANLLKKREELEMLKEMAKTQSSAASSSNLVPKMTLKPSGDGGNLGGIKSKQASILSQAIKRKTTSKDESPSAEKVQKTNNSEPVLQQVSAIQGLIDYAPSSDSESSCSDSDDDDVAIGALRTHPRQKKQQPNCGE